MSNLKTLTGLAGTFVVGVLGSGCAHDAPPRELVDARAAYQRAQYGEANELAPGTVHEARTKLDKAERAYKDEGQSAKTVDMAYVAKRTAQRAEIEADTLSLKREQQKLNEAQQRQGRAAEEELVRTQQILAQERAARQQAEARTKEALAGLSAAHALSLKEEERGVVLTMPGNVMFASGKTQLRPAAQQQLDEVATALKDDQDHQILIEGHTDSKGKDERNQQLSQARAEAVRNYLVTRGLDETRVRAVGLGASRPVAENDTEEGRATNRRVEIVIQSNQGAASTMGAGQPSEQPGRQSQPTAPSL